MKKKKVSKKISPRKTKAAVKPARKTKASKTVVKKKVAKKAKKKISTPVTKKIINPSLKKVAKKSEEEFPGYPHYPATQDIMNPKKGYAKKEFTETSRKLVAPPSPRKKKGLEREKMEEPILEAEEETLEMEITESDLDPSEKKLLESDQLSEDLGEDQELRTRVYPVDMTADDLDVPGTELDDEAEELGEEDEENNPYSIGGDRHEDMEQSHDPGR